MSDVVVAHAPEEHPRFTILRSDTLLGPCQALGEEVGFDPTLLRIGLCAMLFWNPAIVIGGYVGAAAFLALIDWLFPRRRDAAEQVPAQIAAVDAPAAPADRDHRQPELIAA